MDQDRPLARRRNFELANEPLPLHVARRALVVVVQTDFAAGNYLGLGQQRVQLGQTRLRPPQSCCADRCLRSRKAWEACWARPLNSRQMSQRLVHLRRPFANADGEHRAHARFPRAAEALPRGPRRSAGCQGAHGNRSANVPLRLHGNSSINRSSLVQRGRNGRTMRRVPPMPRLVYHRSRICQLNPGSGRTS